MQPKSVVLTLESPVPHPHICENSVMWRLLLFFFIFFPFNCSLGQSFISAIADRYQYIPACFDFSEAGSLQCRHPGNINKTAKLHFGIYGENSLIPGGRNYFNTITLVPVPTGNLSVLVDYVSAGDLHEMQGGIGYSRQLWPAVQMGIRFNYYRLRINGYGSASAFPVEWGVVFQLMPRLRTSLCIYNLMGSGLKGEGLYRIPIVARFGAGYTINNSLGIGLEVVKEMGKPVSFQPMLFYQPGEKLFFRGGIAAANRTVFLSCGYMLGQMRLDLSSAFQGILGWTTGLGLQFTTRQKEKP